MVFNGFWLVSMVFQGGFMVFHGFWLVSMGFQCGFMVFGWFPWFFNVVSWFLKLNCVLCYFGKKLPLRFQINARV